MASQSFGEVVLTEKGAVGEIVFSRPPDNFFDGPLLENVANALEAVDSAAHLRAVVLAAEGRSFCAGMNFAGASYDPAPVYEQALRMYACRKPIVAAVQGAAIGGGLGVALAADFRVVSPETRFAGNFVKLGIHPGFGLTITLPRLVRGSRATRPRRHAGAARGGHPRACP
jgi:enoyl-CoA hydratase/carnithine racemase